MTTISVKVEFSGGLELLFSNQRRHTVELSAAISTSKEPTLQYLIEYLRDNLLKERVELFVENDTVYALIYLHQKQISVLIIVYDADRRPGILVLVNDTDWELEGEGEYVLKNNDEIVFISTLHGG